MSIIEASGNIALKRVELVSNVFHPWVVLVPVLASAAYQATGNPLDCIKGPINTSTLKIKVIFSSF